MDAQNRKIIGRRISIAIVIGAVVMGFVVLYRTNYYPRTDDAEIFANFIGIAPQVPSGAETIPGWVPLDSVG